MMTSKYATVAKVIIEAHLHLAAPRSSANKVARPAAS